MGNATAAARKAGYMDGPASTQPGGKGKGSGLRSHASRLLDRKDISDAIVEECTRRLSADLPVNLALVQSIATGTAGSEERPIGHAVRLKALEMMLNRGGLGESLNITQKVEVEVTVRDRWEKVARMVAARGESPTDLLRNLPGPEREAILRAIEWKNEIPIDIEAEEVEE